MLFMKNKFLGAIVTGLGILLLCSTCFAEVEKKYDPKALGFTVESLTQTNCISGQWVTIYKRHDFSKKKNIDKANVMRGFVFFRITRIPQPYILVEIRTLDGSYKSELKPISNKADPYGKGYLNNIGFVLSRGLISKSVFGNNDPLINLIQKQKPFYIDIKYVNGTEHSTVSELIDGQLLKDWLEVLEYDLEKDQEWYSKMSSLFPKKK